MALLKKRLLACLVLIVSTLFTSQHVMAADIAWNGAGDGTSWSDPANWNLSRLPAAGDIITIAGTANVVINSDVTLTNNTLMLQGSANLIVNDQISATLNATLTIASDSHIILDAPVGNGPGITVLHLLENFGSITITGGFLDIIASPGGGGLGRLNNQPTGSITLNPDTPFYKSVIYNSNTIYNYGVIDNSATVLIDQDTSLHNFGTFNNYLQVVNSGRFYLESTGELVNQGSFVNDCGSLVNPTAKSIGPNSPQWPDTMCWVGGGDGASWSITQYWLERPSNIARLPVGTDNILINIPRTSFGLPTVTLDRNFTLGPSGRLTIWAQQRQSIKLIVQAGNTLTLDGGPMTAQRVENHGTIDLYAAAEQHSMTYLDNYGLVKLNGPVTIAFLNNMGTIEQYCGAELTNSNFTGNAILDKCPPAVTVPANITVEATSGLGATVNFTVSATDDRDGAITPICTYDSGSIFPLGDTLVECTAEDSSGNIGTNSFMISVVDNTPPVITAPADIIVTQTATLTPVSEAELGVVTATDIVDSSLTITNDSPGDFPLGKSIVTWTAIDDSGNSSQDTQQVWVKRAVIIAPTADAGGPYQANKGQVITFDASASFDTDGTIELYEWDLDNDGLFDDGTGMNVSLTFAQDGIYPVHLRVTDDDGASDVDSTTATIQNFPPTAYDVFVSTAQDQPVQFSLNGSDPGTDPLTYTVLSDPAHGTLSGTPPALTFSPAPGWAGTDSFTYLVYDGMADSNVATVTINVGYTILQITDDTLDSFWPKINASGDIVFNTGGTVIDFYNGATLSLNPVYTATTGCGEPELDDSGNAYFVCDSSLYKYDMCTDSVIPLTTQYSEACGLETISGLGVPRDIAVSPAGDVVWNEENGTSPGGSLPGSKGMYFNRTANNRNDMAYNTAVYENQLCLDYTGQDPFVVAAGFLPTATGLTVGKNGSALWTESYYDMNNPLKLTRILRLLDPTSNTLGQLDSCFEESTVTNCYGNWMPQMNGAGDVVWVDKATSLQIFFNLNLYTAASNTTTELTQANWSSRHPSINASGQIAFAAAYTGRPVFPGQQPHSTEIWLYDPLRIRQTSLRVFCISCSEHLFLITDDYTEDYDPVINDRGDIAWYGIDQAGTTHVFLYDFMQDSVRDVYQTAAGSISNLQITPLGDLIWQNGPELFVYDFAISSTTRLSSAASQAMINDKGIVVWAGDDGNDTEIFAAWPVAAQTSGAIPRPDLTGAPVLRPDRYITAEDMPVSIAAPGPLCNDSDPQGDTLTVTGSVSFAGPQNGVLSLFSDGAFDYLPDMDWFGTDGFSYIAGDGTNESQTVVRLLVEPVNDPPVAVDDTFMVEKNAAITFDRATLLSNDSVGAPYEGTYLAVDMATLTDPPNGTLSYPNGLQITYTPNPDFCGTDSFTYRASDGELLSNAATVTFRVTSGLDSDCDGDIDGADLMAFIMDGLPGNPDDFAVSFGATVYP